MAKFLFALVAASTFALAGCMSTDKNGEKDTSVAELHALYADNPFMDLQGMKIKTLAHEWLDNGDGTWNFLHWNNDDPMMATGFLFKGDMVGPLMGCKGAGGISPAQVDAGFVHFHKATAASWDAGHHPDASNPHAMGYWLRHTTASAAGDGLAHSGIGHWGPVLDDRGSVKAC